MPISDIGVADGGSGTEPSVDEPGGVMLKLNLNREERDGVGVTVRMK